MDRNFTLVTDAEPHAAPEPDASDDVVEEVLLEEISIDGMCGVY